MNRATSRLALGLLGFVGGSRLGGGVLGMLCGVWRWPLRGAGNRLFLRWRRRFHAKRNSFKMTRMTSSRREFEQKITGSWVRGANPQERKLVPILAALSRNLISAPRA